MRGLSNQSLIFFSLLVSSCFLPLTTEAQTGVITGRVVTEDGTELPGVWVSLIPVTTDRRKSTSGSQGTATDEEGNFKFTGLAPRVYSVSVWSANGYMSVKGYVPRPIPANERQDGGYHRVGDNVTITMIKGGVITGRVTNAAGAPLIDVLVNATMVRDAEGNPALRAAARLRFTDDRGYYRIYGLSPGTYIVYASNAFLTLPTPYDGKAPTYHPSSTRDTAAEVTVTSGGEASGVDIRFRGDPGHAVSGSVSGSGESSSSYARQIIALTSAVNGAVQSDAHFIHIDKGDAKFAIFGVADGEYEITARWVLDSEEVVLASTPRRVVVKGADVGGIELKLLPMGSIAGKFAIEATPGVCESKRKWSLEEALLALRYESKPGEAPPARSHTVVNGVNEKGEFTVYNLKANRYFLEPRLPNETWYVKSITSPALTSAPTNAGGAAERAAASNAARNGITLKAGEKISGITVSVADGAALVSGKVIPATEGLRLPAGLRIHLVPAEAIAANDVLRYAEVFARANGSFLLSNLAPGKYWLIVRAAPDDEMSDSPPAPIAWDANEWAKLHHEAMAAKNEIELQPCGRIKDYVLRFNR